MFKLPCYLCMFFFVFLGSLSAQEPNPLVDQAFAQTATVDDYRVVIEGGADVNMRGEEGRVPLHFAVRWSSAEAVRLLLQAGATPNVQNDGKNTPLHWASSSWGDVDKVRLLLDYGADANARTGDGGTPLTMAVGYGGTIDTVLLLLERGADASAITPELLELVADPMILDIFLPDESNISAGGPSASPSNDYPVGVVVPSGASKSQVQTSCADASDAAGFAICAILAYRISVLEKEDLDRSFMDQIVDDLAYKYPPFKCAAGLEKVELLLVDLRDVQAQPKWAPRTCEELASVFSLITGMKSTYASCPPDVDYSYAVFEACIDVVPILEYERILLDAFVRITGSSDQSVSRQYSQGMMNWAGRWHTPYGLAEDLKLSVVACLSETGLEGLAQYELLRPAFASGRTGALPGNVESLFEEQRILPTCAHIAQFLSDRGIVAKQDVEPLLAMSDGTGNFDKCSTLRPNQAPLVTEVKETTRVYASTMLCNQSSFPVEFMTSLGSLMGGIEAGEPGTCITMSMGMPTNVVYLGFRASSCSNLGTAEASCEGFIQMSCDSTEMMACPNSTMEMSAHAMYRYDESSCGWKAYALQVDPSTFGPVE